MMDRSRLHLLAAGVILLASASAVSAEGVQWAKSFNKAKKQAKESGRLMMVDFYADW